jgi:hypothetical protein
MPDVKGFVVDGRREPAHLPVSHWENLLTPELSLSWNAAAAWIYAWFSSERVTPWCFTSAEHMTRCGRFWKTGAKHPSADWPHVVGNERKRSAISAVKSKS